MFVTFTSAILTQRGFPLTVCQPWCEWSLAWEASHYIMGYHFCIGFATGGFVWQNCRTFAIFC